MAGYVLCRTEQTEYPFFIRSIGKRIYSLEELCYCLSRYVYLIDETILNEELCAWIGERLGLVRLQKLLLRVLERGGNATEFLMPVFQECGYLTGQQLRYFQEQLAQIQVEPEAIRKKRKADYLVSFGNYAGAIDEYDRILAARGPGRLGNQFYAAIWENMGAAYARQFQFEQAAECLWESWQLLKSKKVYQRYLSVLPLFLSERQCRDRLAEIRADRELAQERWEETKRLLEEGSRLAEEARQEQQQSTEEELEELRRNYCAETRSR